MTTRAELDLQEAELCHRKQLSALEHQLQRARIDLKYAKSVISETHAFAARMAMVNPDGPGLATIRDTLSTALASIKAGE